MTDRFDVMAEKLLQLFDNSTRDGSRVALADAIRGEVEAAEQQNRLAQNEVSHVRRSYLHEKALREAAERGVGREDHRVYAVKLSVLTAENTRLKVELEHEKAKLQSAINSVQRNGENATGWFKRALALEKTAQRVLDKRPGSIEELRTLLDVDPQAEQDSSRREDR